MARVFQLTIIIDIVFISGVPDVFESWCNDPAALCNLMDQVVHPLANNAPVVHIRNAAATLNRQTCAQLWLLQQPQRRRSKRLWSIGNQHVAVMFKRQSLDPL